MHIYDEYNYGSLKRYSFIHGISIIIIINYNYVKKKGIHTIFIANCITLGETHHSPKSQTIKHEKE